MLALGVLIGSVTKSSAENAGFATVLLEEPVPPAEESAAEPTATAAGAEAGGGEAAVPTATPAAIPTEAPLVEEPLPGAPEPEAPLVEEELPTGLPEVKHVFVVMLKEGGVEETGKTAEASYLGEELPQQGELLSGQGPTPETAANCPSYADLAPGTESAEGQVEGSGCVYPAATKTLPGQLAEAGLKWKAYVQGIEDD